MSIPPFCVSIMVSIIPSYSSRSVDPSAMDSDAAENASSHAGRTRPLQGDATPDALSKETEAKMTESLPLSCSTSSAASYSPKPSFSGGGVYELLECPVCTNCMFPPIHQACPFLVLPCSTLLLPSELFCQFCRRPRLSRYALTLIPLETRLQLIPCVVRQLYAAP